LDKFKFGDIIAGITVLLCAVISALVIYMPGDGDMAEVVVTCGDDVMYYPLSADAEFTVNGVTVVIGSGCVYVSDSDCRDKICVNTGKISRVGQSLVCLPAQVSVAVVGNGGDVIVAG